MIKDQQKTTIWLMAALAMFVGRPSLASEVEPRPNDSTNGQISSELPPVSKILSIDEVEQPATTVAEWLAQIEEADTTPITGVRLQAIDTGIEVILETTNRQLSEPVTTTVGQTLTVDIPNAVLQLPEGREFRQVNPTAGVAEIVVTNELDNRVRVTLTGAEAAPTATVRSGATGLTLSIVPGAELVGEADEVEITVTAEPEEGYAPRNATTATRTDTPLRDIPQSIQVVPQQVIEDQAAVTLRDALRNVSGVVEGDNFGGNLDSFIIRGFFGTTLRNGFRGRSFGQFATETTLNELSNLDRVEVLKGPAALLYGNAEPGGIINLVSKQPLAEPYYSADLQIGNFGFVKPTVDISGPVTNDRSVRYRLNATYQNAEDFRGPFDQNFQRFFISPVLAWDISEQTNLTVELAYLNDRRPFDQGIVAFGDGIADIPFSRNLGEPDDFFDVEQLNIGFQLKHRFNENLQWRTAFNYLRAENFDYKVQPGDLDEGTGILPREFDSNNDIANSYGLQTELQADFKTGPVQHKLLIGLDLTRQTTDGTNRSIPIGTPINIFDPVYLGKPDLSEFTTLGRDNFGAINTIGIFLQDQISLLDNLKFLIGGRFDAVDLRNENRIDDTLTTQSDSAFTPRLGLIYQPIQPISLYAGYGQSFNPNFARDVSGSFLAPEKGNQFEVGIKAELNPKLSLNLAAYQLTKNNIATTDLVNSDFSVAIGEIRSRGIELDVAGEILPGWNIIASYAYTDSRITESNDSPVGLKTALVPENAFSIWTNYELQGGALKGLGFGVGLYYLSERPGDFVNSYTLPSFLRTDAALFYKRNNLRLAINIRNLFNQDYIESVAFGRSRITPGEPFTIIGSISYEF
jgi:iron complex outermembrane recepter protein